MASSIFALLPTELVRLVLEFSAQESSQTAARLLRVSKAVNEWVQPLLYETFILDLSTLLRFFEPQLNYHNHGTGIVLPSRSFAPQVRNLCINFAGISISVGNPSSLPNTNHLRVRVHNGGNAREDVGFINACVHLSNLYLDIGFDAVSGGRPPMPTTAHHLSSSSIRTTLTHLHCATWESWFFMSRALELLTALTHLRLDVTYDRSIFRTFLPIVHGPPFSLPNLTHFAIGADSLGRDQQLRATANMARTFVLQRPDIHMVVISAWYCWDSTSDGIRQAFLRVADDSEAVVVMHEKVCILGMGGSLDGRLSIKEWENEARGKQSIWSRAQELLDAQARRKETEGRGIAMGPRELIELIF